MTPQEALETFTKEELTDLIIEYSETGYFPIELFLLRADNNYSADELKEMWNSLYQKAREYEESGSDLGAELLADAAEAVFEAAQNFSDEEAGKDLCRFLVSELTDAAEEDGIGMYCDSEWLYEEIQDEIEEYLG